MTLTSKPPTPRRCTTNNSGDSQEPPLIDATGDGQDEALGAQMRIRARQSLGSGIVALVLYPILVVAGLTMVGPKKPSAVLPITFILTVFVALILSIRAIVFGVQGRKAANTLNRGTGTSGMVLGIIDVLFGSVLLAVIGLVWIIKILGHI